MTTLLLALSFVLAAPAALADDKPSIEVRDDGVIVARMTVDASETDVRAAIPAMQNASETPTSVLSVKMWRDGRCHGIFRQTRGLFSPLEITTRLCPTTSGWREVLVDSEDYNAYDVEWVVSGSGDRTQVEMKVRSAVNLAVPTSMVRTGTIASLNETFDLLLKRLLGKSAAK